MNSLLLYAVADIHGSQYRMNLLLNHIEQYSPDLVVICGDITQFGPAAVAENFVKQIPVDTIGVYGNCDPIDTGDAIELAGGKNIDRRKISYHGLDFVGIGGDGKDLAFDTEILHKKRVDVLVDVLDSSSIVVSHVPPYRTNDKVFIGHYAGNKVLRELVDLRKPRLVLSGHIHEDPGFVLLDQSMVVNCSIGKRTEGAMVTVNDTISVKILD